MAYYKEIVQEQECNNLIALVKDGIIDHYICTVTGRTPACHLKVSDKDWVDLESCKNRI